MILVDPETGETFEVSAERVHGVEPFDFPSARRIAFTLSKERRAAEAAYREATAEKAAAERDYRVALAEAVMEARREHGATLAETIAKGTEKVSQAVERKLKAADDVTAWAERIRLCSEERATFHRFQEWSMRLDPETWQESARA